MRTIIPNSQYLCNYAVRWCTWSAYLVLAWYSVMVVKATSLLNPVASGMLGGSLLFKLLVGRRGSPDICWPARTPASAQRLFLQPAVSFRSLEGLPPPASGPLHISTSLSGLFLPLFTSLTETHPGSRFTSSFWDLRQIVFKEVCSLTLNRLSHVCV